MNALKAFVAEEWGLQLQTEYFVLLQIVFGRFKTNPILKGVSCTSSIHFLLNSHRKGYISNVNIL